MTIITGAVLVWAAVVLAARGDAAETAGEARRDLYRATELIKSSNDTKLSSDLLSDCSEYIYTVGDSSQYF